MPTLARSGHGRRGVPAVRVGTAPAGSNGLGTEESSTTYIYIYMEHMENVEEYMGGALFRSISFLGGDNMLCQGEESILK